MALDKVEQHLAIAKSNYDMEESKPEENSEEELRFPHEFPLGRLYNLQVTLATEEDRLWAGRPSAQRVSIQENRHESMLVTYQYSYVLSQCLFIA